MEAWFTFLEVKKQYGALVYNFENIHEISNDDLHFTIINSQLFLVNTVDGN
jgi:hypothetical protein